LAAFFAFGSLGVWESGSLDDSCLRFFSLFGSLGVWESGSLDDSFLRFYSFFGSLSKEKWRRKRGEMALFCLHFVIFKKQNH
jgi:hypothetical protein